MVTHQHICGSTNNTNKHSKRRSDETEKHKTDTWKMLGIVLSGLYYTIVTIVTIVVCIVGYVALKLSLRAREMSDIPVICADDFSLLTGA
jgi:hypothetical protein